MQPQQRKTQWQAELAGSIRNAQELRQALSLPATAVADTGGKTLAAEFPLRVPQAYVRRMQPGDSKDPLLLQILPQARESDEHPATLTDPLRERRYQPLPGIVHKYSGRALWMLSGACPVHCRYCFRRHLPYSEMVSGVQGAEAVFGWLAQQPQISELILSGGDPLSLPDRVLAALAARLKDLAGLRTLRLHTRFPVVLPARVDNDLLAWMGDWRASGKELVVMLHLNHVREIDDEVVAAAQKLAAVGARLYAQSVLLAGINDEADSLQALFDGLWSAGVQPYYLNLLDPVRGAMHFDVPQWRAQQIYGELSARMAGYRLPKLVRETPGMPAKSLIPPTFSAAAH